MVSSLFGVATEAAVWEDCGDSKESEGVDCWGLDCWGLDSWGVDWWEVDCWGLGWGGVDCWGLGGGGSGGKFVFFPVLFLGFDLAALLFLLPFLGCGIPELELILIFWVGGFVSVLFMVVEEVSAGILGFSSLEREGDLFLFCMFLINDVSSEIVAF